MFLFSINHHFDLALGMLDEFLQILLSELKSIAMIDFKFSNMMLSSHSKTHETPIDPTKA
jgi:hypothetical protein